MSKQLKSGIHSFWNQQSCGEVYANGSSEKEYYQSHAQARYKLEPYIADFANFQEGSNKDILEIGVGMGADHIEWAKSHPKSLTGIDLTDRAIQHTKKRFTVYNFCSKLDIGDAENLPFCDNNFDIVYSWGVLHHTPNTQKAIKEVFRVLRPGGICKIMIYHKYSIVGYLLWIKYGLLRAQPFRSLQDIYFHHLESPGTKAYSKQEALEMFHYFSNVSIKRQLSFGDLLQGKVGQKHHSKILSVAKKIWPKTFIKTFMKQHGLMLLITAKK